MRWIIGDVHGMASCLSALIDAVLRRDAQATFYFVGDYINRGPDSRGVVELVLQLPGARCVRGNHDDIFDTFLRGAMSSATRARNDAEVAFSSFMQHGLAETLLSYGVDKALLQIATHRPSVNRLAALAQTVPESHRDFFRNLPVIIEEPDLFVAHAYWPPARPTASPNISQQIEADETLATKAIWQRFEHREIAGSKAWTSPGYFGHTPVNNYPGFVDFLPIAGEQMVLLDTAVALHRSGQLTAACAETGEFLQISRDGKERGSLHS